MQPQEILLSKYKEPDYTIDKVHLSFKLIPKATVVKSRLRLNLKNRVSSHSKPPLVLHGKGLKLLYLAIDGKELDKHEFKLSIDQLEISNKSIQCDVFELECHTEINPQDNTELEGLYLSNGIYCTQCEPEGFRKITYYLDRPDVLTKYKVRIEGNHDYLLSNGNLKGTGTGWAEWEDPWPKPSYLFALVCGNLKVVEDEFVTMSGNRVLLQIYVEPGDEAKCAHAMKSLKRSMAWDEQQYQREYDLDRFMIVAISDFNMGAMENKGLNIFNSKYVLADEKTATDTDFEMIERIIAHEYFHNWTGNRITCRDWFQLCLKEGLTVFRDQQFSADMQNKEVVRIEDVILLKNRQFREDAGPLRHAVRPSKYIEINNFYTATVYEKGAEIIRMLHSIVGEETYKKAVNLYFDKHDGQASTIEHWIKVFEDSTGRDLKQFSLWYEQSGTPTVISEENFRSGTYTIKLTQEIPCQTDDTEGKPMVIPIKLSFISKEGNSLTDDNLMVLTKKTQNFMFSGFEERPIPVMLGDFSAPIILKQERTSNDYLTIMGSDSNAFCIWEATQKIYLELLETLIKQEQPSIEIPNILHNLIEKNNKNPAFLSKLLTLPSHEELTVHMLKHEQFVDPEKIHLAKEKLDQNIAELLKEDLNDLYDAIISDDSNFDHLNSGKRHLKTRYLEFITALDKTARKSQLCFDTAQNMTEILHSLKLLVKTDNSVHALPSFYESWKHNPLLIDKWFSIQAIHTPANKIFKVIETLSLHPDFGWKNPNRFRSLIGAFALNNSRCFHSKDGNGYKIIASWVKKIDPVNPQVAARLCTAFETINRLEPKRKKLMKSSLKNIRYSDNISKDTMDITTRLLKL